MNRRVKTFAILGAILVLAASLRVFTFYLPHNHGDQIFYLGLAMKLEKFGLKGYNLQGIDVLSNEYFVAVTPSENSTKGNLLEGLEKENIFYYSQEPLSKMPPAFSYLLMMSHKIFSREKLFVAVDKNLGPDVVFVRPQIFLKTQFYAVWISFAFSILFIYVTFLLGKLFFNEKVGLWASFLIAISPVDLLTSQRIWTDDMLAFFIALCVLLFWYGRIKNNALFTFLSGVSVGIATITKGSGIFIMIIIVLFNILTLGKNSAAIRGTFRHVFIFIAASIATAALWYYRVAMIYGTPFPLSGYQKDIEKVSAWFSMLNERSRFCHFYYFVCLTPFFIFFYIEAIQTILRKAVTKEKMFLLLWFLFFTIILVKIRAKEERYMLPAYPAIAILSAVAIEDVRRTLRSVIANKFLCAMVIVCISLACTAWSIYIGLRHVFNNAAIFNL